MARSRGMTLAEPPTATTVMSLIKDDLMSLVGQTDYAF
jgi:hypothetical protein